MKTFNAINNQRGFTLIELFIVMAIFVIALAISSDTFSLILRQSVQQSKIAEVQIETTVGLNILRTDIEHAGYGLPWAFQSSISYNEAVSDTVCGGATTDPANYNDSTGNPPRAILGGNNLCINSSDYLAIKAVNVARSDTAQRWSYIVTGSNPKTWGSEDISNGERVIVIQPSAGETTYRQLVMNGSTFYTTYSSTAFSASFSPDDTSEMFIIYGVDSDTNLRMPFNRADYYISTSSVPSTCASGTGVLRKAILSHASGAFPGASMLPILDCVADMQVIYVLDMDENGTALTSSNADGSSVSSAEGATAATVQSTLASAELLRKRLKEVRVYILSHEGQKDVRYTYPSSTITVGDSVLGKTFDLTAITDYQNYRWKVYPLAVKPKNLQ
jgi:prepilin-type N-terminal cleavage/methylation domain-containing protein